MKGLTSTLLVDEAASSEYAGLRGRQQNKATGISEKTGARK